MADFANIDVKTMDYSYMGEPYVWYSLDPNINFYTMDYSYWGQPLVIASPSGGNIKSFCGILRADLKNLSTTKSLVGIVD